MVSGGSDKTRCFRGQAGSRAAATGTATSWRPPAFHGGFLPGPAMSEDGGGQGNRREGSVDSERGSLRQRIQSATGLLIGTGQLPPKLPTWM
jgi:hypothetical protein